MALSNTDLRLAVLMKKGEISFREVKRAVDAVYEGRKKLGEIFQIALPESIGRLSFSYETKARDRKHSLFHLILLDLDALVSSGLASRSYAPERETGELVEVYRITDKGVAQVARFAASLHDELRFVE